MQLRVRQTPLDLLVYLLAGLLVLAMVGLSGAESWDKTVAMVKKEGKLVVVLGGGGSRRYRPVFKFFEDKFGIRTVVPTGSGREHDLEIQKKRLEMLKRAEELYMKIRGK